jgi:hypothetical protein
MQKRSFLQSALTVTTMSGAAAPLAAQAQYAPKTAGGPVILTVSGLIGAGNRGALDPALDQMMKKQNVHFHRAQVFDFAALNAMPAISIRPTLEYDSKKHLLKGPLLMDVMKASGVKTTDKTSLLLRAVDGYAVLVPAAEATSRGFIVATHIDDRPMSLGSLGPLWAIYDADRFPDMAAKPLTERFREPLQKSSR